MSLAFLLGAELTKDLARLWAHQVPECLSSDHINGFHQEQHTQSLQGCSRADPASEEPVSLQGARSECQGKPASCGGAAKARCLRLNLTMQVLTPDEFVAAGNHLVRTCPTWSW